MCRRGHAACAPDLLRPETRACVISKRRAPCPRGGRRLRVFVRAAITRRQNPPPIRRAEPPMAVERTLSIIKPDATRRNLTGKINARFEERGLRIVAQKRLRLARDEAEGFYAVHKARPFFNDLVTIMISGP